MSEKTTNNKVGNRIPRLYKSNYLTSSKRQDKTNENVGIDPNVVASITGDNLKRSSTNKDATIIFADIEKAIEIMIASTLSPKDLITVKLIFKNTNKSLPTDILGGMHTIAEEHILEHFDIVDELPKIIREGYFTKGSYATLVVPDTVLYSMSEMKIPSNENKTSEYKELDIEKAYKNINTKILKSDITGISTDIEEADIKNVIDKYNINIEVTRDLSLLKPVKYSGDLSILSTEDKSKNLYTSLGIMDLDSIPESEGESDGIAFRKSIPTEALTPVHAPGEPDNHLGYYLALDENNLPVTNEDLMVYANDMDNDFNSASGIIKETKDTITKDLFNNETPTLENMDAIYNLILRRSLTKALSDSGLGITPEIDKQSEIYSLLFKKALTENNVKLVYIPAKYLTYYAYEYRKNGTGKSILEKCTLMFSIRSMLLMTRILGNLNNTLPTTVVDVAIPDSDNDPKSTMSIIKSLVYKRSANNVPVFSNDMDSIIDWVTKYGYKFNFKHKSLPNIEYEKKQEVNEKVIPDIELEEDIRDQIFTIIGLSSNYITAKSQIEFATEALIEDKFLTRRVIKIQDTTMKFVTSDVRKIVRCDNNLLTKFTNLIKPKLKTINESINKYSGGNITIKDKYTDDEEKALIKNIIYIYTKSLKITLPRPEKDIDDQLSEAFERKLEALESATDLLLSSDYLDPTIFGDITDDLDTLKKTVIYTQMREWCIENGYMTELANIVDYDRDNELVSHIIEKTFEYRDAYSKVLLKYFKQNKKKVEKLNEAKEKIENDDEEEETPNDNNDDNDTPPEDIPNDSDVPDEPVEGDESGEDVPKDEDKEEEIPKD